MVCDCLMPGSALLPVNGGKILSVVEVPRRGRFVWWGRCGSRLGRAAAVAVVAVAVEGEALI